MRMKKFVKYIADTLNIEPPELVIGASDFKSGNALAHFDAEGNRLCLKSGDVTPQNLFRAAHEMRHIWQMQHKELGYFNDYVSAGKAESITAFNGQPEEIDANAFAAAVIIKIFGIIPQFKGLTDETKEKIYRAAEKFDL